MTTRRSVLAMTRRSDTSPAMTSLGGWIQGGSSGSCERDGSAIEFEISKKSSMAQSSLTLPPIRDRPRHGDWASDIPVSYTHLRAHETVLDLVCRLLLEK